MIEMKEKVGDEWRRLGDDNTNRKYIRKKKRKMEQRIRKI